MLGWQRLTLYIKPFSLLSFGTTAKKHKKNKMSRATPAAERSEANDPQRRAALRAQPQGGRSGAKKDPQSAIAQKGAEFCVN